MPNENRFFADLSRVADGALNALSGIKTQTESVVRQQIERFLGQMNLVTREEFEAVEKMAAKARDEQEALTARVAELEARLASSSAPARTPTRRTSPTRKKTMPPATEE